MNNDTLRTQMHALLDQSGASEFSCVYALADGDRNQLLFGSLGSCGDATAEVGVGNVEGVAYALPNEAAAKRLMKTYASISIMANQSAWALCQQCGWDQEKFRALLNECADTLAAGSQTSDDQ